MYENYKKECYDTNPHYKVHHSHGVQKYNEKLNHLHYDKDLVIEYFRKGTTSKRIEGNIYSISEGDIVITTPAELHIPLRTEDCYIEKISIHINESLLSVFGGDQTVFFAKIVNKEKGVGNIIVADIVRELGLDKELDQCLRYAEDFSLESQVLLSCKIIELLATISKFIDKDTIKDLSPTSSNKIINEMINYINRHYTEDITLDTLAQRFHFSKYYISHLFKDYVGVSPYDYLIIRRLYICNDLIRGKHTIKEACFLVGFHNYSNFYRLYKKHFKITPQQFRRSI